MLARTSPRRRAGFLVLVGLMVAGCGGPPFPPRDVANGSPPKVLDAAMARGVVADLSGEGGNPAQAPPDLAAKPLAADRPVRPGTDPLLQNNVVIILDASGSMMYKMPGGMTRMDAAKAALWEVLTRIPDGTQVGLVVFGARDSDDGWVFPLGPRDDTKLKAVMDRIVPYSVTPLGACIKTAADGLLKQRAEQQGFGTYRLLIVTDGNADDPALVDRYVPEVLGRGIALDVIGVSMKEAHTLATRAHSYRSADRPASLRKAVAEAFAEVGKTDTDALGGDAFRRISSMPPGVARELVKGLSVVNNDPIGETPKAAGADAP